MGRPHGRVRGLPIGCAVICVRGCVRCTLSQPVSADCSLLCFYHASPRCYRPLPGAQAQTEG